MLEQAARKKRPGDTGEGEKKDDRRERHAEREEERNKGQEGEREEALFSEALFSYYYSLSEYSVCCWFIYCSLQSTEMLHNQNNYV